MIKIEHVVTASPEQMGFIIEGMRNPLNSWEKSDSCHDEGNCRECLHRYEYNVCNNNPIYDCYNFKLGSNDKSLMTRLAKAGTDHRKFMRMIPIYARITASHTWWAEFDTYKVGTVRNSCSKMHKIHVMGFERDSFDHEGIDKVGTFAIEAFDNLRDTLTKLSELFNETKDKKYWRAMIELLPMGFHITANVEINYEVAANIYYGRRYHKLDEWKEFCKWIESLPYFDIIGSVKNDI